MWELMSNWLPAVIGSLLLGILGNLLTKPVTATYSRFSSRFRKRNIEKIVSSYNVLVNLAKEKKLPIVLHERGIAVTTTAVWYCGMAILGHVGLVISLLAKVPKTDQADWVEAWQSDLLVYSMLTTYLILGYGLGWAMTAARKQFNDACRFAMQPEKFRSVVVRRLSRLDPAFDAEIRLTRVNEPEPTKQV